MLNNSPSFWSKIKLFPHIIPIGFPLIFPIGFGLLGGLFNLLFPVILVMLLILAGLFVYRLITLGSADAAWSSIKGTGTQWQQRFTGRGPQMPFYQPSQPQTPYYQPSQPQQPAETPYYQPSQEANRPQAQYPEQQ